MHEPNYDDVKVDVRCRRFSPTLYEVISTATCTFYDKGVAKEVVLAFRPHRTFHKIDEGEQMLSYIAEALANEEEVLFQLLKNKFDNERREKEQVAPEPLKQVA